MIGVMKIRMFTLRASMWTWKLDVTIMEREISQWLTFNKDITVREIHHDRLSGFCMPPQLVVTIYYT